MFQGPPIPIGSTPFSGKRTQNSDQCAADSDLAQASARGFRFALDTSYFTLSYDCVLCKVISEKMHVIQSRIHCMLMRGGTSKAAYSSQRTCRPTVMNEITSAAVEKDTSERDEGGS